MSGQPATWRLLARRLALAAPMDYFIEERMIGPTLGAGNIAKGFQRVLGLCRDRGIYGDLLHAVRPVPALRWRSTCCRWWRCCRCCRATLTPGPGMLAASGAGAGHGD
jgi:hypothetical protein